MVTSMYPDLEARVRVRQLRAVEDLLSRSLCL